MTSATLAVGDGLRYFVNRIGGEDAATLQVDSPLRLRAPKCASSSPRKMPEPTAREEYERALAHWIKHFVTMTHGKAFVLFTSYNTMQKLADSLAGFFRSEKNHAPRAGGALPRHRMLQRFKEDRDSVLFGTDSFWQGVDVPARRSAMSSSRACPSPCRTIPSPRPSASASSPTAATLSVNIRLPEAILKFRQGVGRLIRTQSDKGIVVILDNRVLSKPYGKAFLAVMAEVPRGSRRINRRRCALQGRAGMCARFRGREENRARVANSSIASATRGLRDFGRNGTSRAG